MSARKLPFSILDADNDPQPNGGAEDEYYMSLQPPYLAANRLMTDVSELALVRGFNDQVRERLNPFVSALPANTAVNVNTASPEVLSAVIEGLDLDAARALVAQRERAYFRDSSDFLSRLPRGIEIAGNDFKVSSDYFVGRVRVTIGNPAFELIRQAVNGQHDLIVETARVLDMRFAPIG